jgi:hypothetical protein
MKIVQKNKSFIVIRCMVAVANGVKNFKTRLQNLLWSWKLLILGVRRIGLIVVTLIVWVAVIIFSFRTTLLAIAATYVDDSAATFNTGSYDKTQFANNVGVRVTSAGRAAMLATYTSGIKDATATANYQTISWVPPGPYGKELPDNGVTETVYSIGNASMSGVQRLYHLNESSGTVYAETSGQGTDLTCVAATCPGVDTIGKFRNSSSFNGVDQFLTSGTNLASVLGGTSTLAFWIKTTATGNADYLLAPAVTGVDLSAAGNDIIFGWLDETGRIGVHVGTTTNVKSPNPINDGNWYHVAITRLIGNGRVNLFINGSNTAATLENGTKTTPFYSIGRVEKTGGSDSPSYFDGSLDEIVIYNRAISGGEVVSMYRRGVQRLLYQVRSCPTDTCTGVDFKGPTSTTDYYSELGGEDNTLPTKTITNLADNQYFQYKATFEMDVTNLTPAFSSFTIVYSLSLTPVLAFTIRKGDDTGDINACEIGTASIASTSTCSYRLKVTSNAANGYFVYVNTQGGLINGVTTMADAALGNGGGGGDDISITTAGIEKYGALIDQGSITGTGSITLASRFNAGGSNAVNYNISSSTLMATATGENSPLSTDTTNTILVTHKLNMSPNTKPGYYSQSIIYTVSPGF